MNAKGRHGSQPQSLAPYEVDCIVPAIIVLLACGTGTIIGGFLIRGMSIVGGVGGGAVRVIMMDGGTVRVIMIGGGTVRVPPAFDPVPLRRGRGRR